MHDVYSVDLHTGKRTLVLQNDGGFAGFTTDEDMKVRYAARQNPDGSLDFVERDPKSTESDPAASRWKVFVHAPMEDGLTVSPTDFDASGKTVYFNDSRGRDTSAFVAIDTKTGKTKVVAEDPRADAGEVLAHPTKKTIEAVSFEYDKPEWRIIGQVGGAGFRLLEDRCRRSAHHQQSHPRRETLGGRVCAQRRPVRYYLYDRGSPGKPGKATFLGTNEKALENLKLSKMQPVVVKSRDGLDLVSYLTVPRAADADGDGVPDHPLPMVLFVHGGPWARDVWGLNRYHQWLASRGYAVLSVNYRGSTGFGKKFINAANLEWAGKMHDDLLDSVKWAVDHKVADLVPRSPSWAEATVAMRRWWGSRSRPTSSHVESTSSGRRICSRS